jgi:hypothetical protein
MRDAIVQAVLKVVKDSPEWKYICREYVKHCFAKAWDEGKHPRRNDGKFGTGGGSAKPSKPSGKPAKPSQPHKPTGKPSAKPYDAVAQRHAEANQVRLAESLPQCQAIPGNAPSDLEQMACEPRPCHRHQMEMKTLLASKRGSVRMTSAAQARKLERLAQEPPSVRRQWTVVLDHREHYTNGTLDTAEPFPLYIREGTGSFSVASMHKVGSAEELQAVLNTPPDKLPEAAKAPDAGFYATWMASGPKKRKAMAQAAYARERKRIERRQEKKQ